MKKQICCMIAVVTVVTMLPGCGAKDTPADHSPAPAVVSTVTPESTAAPESTVPPESTAAPEQTITEDMAYEGVNNYCHKMYDWSIAEELPDIMYVVRYDETDSEYVVMFRSYTGAHEYFSVDKTTGMTRMTFRDYGLNDEEDGGTMNLWDYLDAEN